jgi:hypothetical protein
VDAEEQMPVFLLQECSSQIGKSRLGWDSDVWHVYSLTLMQTSDTKATNLPTFWQVILKPTLPIDWTPLNSHWKSSLNIEWDRRTASNWPYNR